LFFISIASYSQKSDSMSTEIVINKYNQYLNLNGSNRVLIDNALHCFGVCSTGDINDSLYRVWQLFEPKIENNVEMISLRMFELGKNYSGRVGQIYTLKWFESDTLLKVISISKKAIKPKNGWDVFDSLINIYNINKIHKLDFPLRTDNAMSTFGLSFLQFVDRIYVRTYDFSSRSNNPIDRPTKLFYLLKFLIYTEFPNDFFDYEGPIPNEELEKIIH